MSKMVNISHGHALPGGIGCGAVGFHDESKETKAITDQLVPLLNRHGIESHDCSCNKHVSANQCLQELVAKHNSYKNEDLSVSLHLNSADSEKAEGIEVLVLSTGGDQYKMEVAHRILDAFEEAGFKIRGVKVRTDLYFLKHCNSPSILVEMYFCSSKHDCQLAEKYGHAGMARLLATGITGKPIKDISYGTKVKIKKNIKIRDSKGSDYNRVGIFYAGAVVEVLETNKACTRARVTSNHWISLDSRYVEVIN